MKTSLRSIVLRYMLAVIAITAAIRIGLWLVYQAYESKQGHIVFHEQINEMLLLILVEVLSLAILGIMLWQLSRLLLSPLRSVANAAKLISEGRLEKRIRTRHLPEGELFDIAQALNASFDQYQDAIDRISRFSSAASHQLRTPLANIRNTAELALTRKTDKDGNTEPLQSILEETEHLTRMTEQLLLLSRMEAEYLKDQFDVVDLSEIARQVVDVYQPVIEAKHIALESDIGSACAVRGDATLLMEALINLMDNASKWTPDGGRITMTTSGNGMPSFLLSDSGPGIDDAFRDQLFERFSRHSATPYRGHGLGLSIVSEVIRLHDGHVEIGKGEHGGAVFRLSFPTATASPNLTNL